MYNFPNLKVLICGSMQLNWDAVLKLSKVFTNIEELRAPHNEITCLDTNQDEFLQMKLLDLEGNNIQDWNEACKLTIISTIEHLNLENIGIRKIKFDGCNIFRNLKKLVISENYIDNVSLKKDHFVWVLYFYLCLVGIDWRVE